MAGRNWVRKQRNARDGYNQGWEAVFVTAYREYIQNRKQFQEER